MEKVPAGRKLRGLEFYSGMGGLHYALINACNKLDSMGSKVSADIAMAFDINTTANSVYERNFHSKVCPKTISSFTSEYLDGLQASDIWLLSPPCQPYTRQGKTLDTWDPRAESFLHLLTVIPQMKNRPLLLLIENVVGFESSETRKLLVQMLEGSGYRFQEFHLSPHQIGIPNTRTRYFCLASLETTPIGPPSTNSTSVLNYIPECGLFDAVTHLPVSAIQPLSTYLEAHSEDPDGGAAFFQPFMVPESVLVKSGMSFDLTFPTHSRSCCFTKNYGRLVEGTGSVLQTAPEHVKGIPNEPDSLKLLKLRYFTPREIARLHGFPDHCDLSLASKKQSYALLGNSLNVTLVSELLVHLLQWTPNSSTSPS